MAPIPSTEAAPPARVLTLTRLLDAPPSLVFEVWTRPEHLARWWGPKDFISPFQQMDARPGGAYRIGIRSPEGVDYVMHGVFREVVEPRRLVFTFAWDEEDSHETLVTVTFAEHAGKTLLMFQQAVFRSVDERDSHEGGWRECLERLAAYLETLCPPVMPTRSAQ